MRSRLVRFTAWVAACVLVLVHAASTMAPEEVRALWVTRATLASPAKIARMVQAARDAGFTTLLVQVRARGDAYYRGGAEPAAAEAFDPLQTALLEARRAGLRVHAWVCVNLVASAVELPASRSHVVYRHPEWLMVPRSLARTLASVDPRSPRYVREVAAAIRRQPDEVEGLYLSPIDPAAADYTVRVVSDIVSRYAVDGVHLDYIRYPTDDFDYSARALALFAAHAESRLSAADARALRKRGASDPLAYVERFPADWSAFRRDRLTALVRRLHLLVEHRRPGGTLSAAVLPDPEEALDKRLQDWRTWAREGAVDVVCPMAYATDAGLFARQVEQARRAAGGRPVWAGIGAYRLSPEETIEDVRIARRHGVAGIVLFSYDSLLRAGQDAGRLTKIGRAVFPGTGE